MYKQKYINIKNKYYELKGGANTQQLYLQLLQQEQTNLFELHQNQQQELLQNHIQQQNNLYEKHKMEQYNLSNGWKH